MVHLPGIARTLSLWLVMGLVTMSGCSSSAPEEPAGAGAAVSPGRIEVTVQEGTSMAAALSPDGQSLAIDLQGSIWVVPAAGGEARRVTDEFYDARQPAWSPDGRQIAFQGFRNGDWDIWTIAPDGTGAKAVTTGPFDDREPHFSHDGTRLAFSSDRSGNYDIWELTLGTGALKQLTKNEGNDYGPAWSPDDREIAFGSDRTQSPGVWAVAAATGAERLVAAESGGRVNAPSWSTDGARVAYNVVGGGTSDLAVDGKPETSGEDVFPFRASWVSPTEFIYTSDGRIKKRSVGGSLAETIGFRATMTLDRTPYTQKRRDFDSQAAHPVRGIVRPAVSPDGQQVAFAALGDIWVLPIGGQARRVTNDAFMDTEPAWSPDGRSLAFSSDRAGGMDIWVQDLQTNAARRLTELPTSDLAPTWSPDGRRIAFVSIDSLFAGEIRVVDVQSRAVKSIHDSVFGPSEPQWSRDGSRIMIASLKRYSSRYREGINQFVTFPSAGGAERAWTVTPHRGSDVRTGAGPVWSPDGRKVAFVMEGALTVMDVSPAGEPAGQPRRITNEIAHSPSWTGDSRQLVYLSNDRLKMVSADGGEPKDLGLELTYTPKVPQGRLVVHAGRLVDGKEAAARTNVDIVVEGHRITAIEPHRQDLHTGNVVDASAYSVMPGLIEMHGHLYNAYGSAMGRAFLAYGVTTVRNPAAVTPYMSLEDREAVEAGVRPGPRIYASGYQMDGSRIYYPLGLSISSAAQLEWELERIGRLDLDFIKTYVRLPDEFQRRVIEYAHANGLPVTSHEIYPAVAVGADGTEHTSGTSRRGYSPKISQLQIAYEDVVQLMARSGMQFTPTASLGAGFQQLAQRDPTLLGDPRYQTLFPEWIVRPARSGRGGGPAGGELRGGQMALAVLNAGGVVLAGTDSPITPYGLALQAELQVLADGGLTPLQALQTATVHAAAALNATPDLGSIEVGKLADLVIVEGDPLADISNARRVRKVVKNGEVYEFDALVRKATD